MNRLFNFLLGMITILSFTNVMGQAPFLSEPTIVPSMRNERDWYDTNTRKYLFSYMYVSRSNPNPEKAADTYDYVRVEREYKVREDGTKYIRWYVDFNAKRPHPYVWGGNFYGVLLGDGLGEIKNLTYSVYDHSNGQAIRPSESGTWNTARQWADEKSKWYYYKNHTYGATGATQHNGAIYLYQNLYRRILYDTSGSFGNYDGPQPYMKPVVHNARNQMVKLMQDGQKGSGQVFVNSGPTQSDAYRYVYQFDTDVLDDTKEHYYIAFHNVAESRSKGGNAQHIVAFLPPPDGQPETTVYVKPTPQTITTEVGVVPNVERGISNLSAFPNTSVWEWVAAPDVSKVGTTQGKAKVTYYVNNEPVRMEVIIPVVVEDNKKDKDIYAPMGNTIRFLNGENLANKAGEFITLPASYPANKAKPTYAWKDGTPTTTTGGSFTKVVNVIYPDNSIDEVNVNLDIVDTPTQDIVQIIRGTSEAQAKEKVKAETDRGNSWQSTEPVVKSVPSTATITTYTGNNGALVTIANTETANGKKVLSASSITGTSYRITNGNVVITTDVRVPVEIVGNNADTYSPTAKTVRILKGEDIDDNAGDFVNLPNAPQGTRYEWVTKPNTSADFTGGQTNIGNNVVKVIYPDGSEENVNGITANVVNTPAQNTKAYILQHSLEADAKNKIQNVTNRPAAWASGKTPEVVGSISTATIGDANATVSIENIFSNNNIITGASSITGTSYSKTDKNLVSIVTNVSVPYTIVNKPVKTDNNAIEVSTGSTISNDNLLAKIGNKDGWLVVSITPPDTNSTGNKTATVVLRHPNLPESDNQTFTIPVNVVARNADTYSPTAKTVRILKGENIDDKAGDFVNLPNAPQGTRYEWVTKPNTSADFTGGQTNIRNNVVKVIYPDGSEENVNGITANVVNKPAQTQAYILQGTPETDAKNKIQAATVRGGGWNNGKAPEVVGSIDTAIVRDDVATVSMGNNISTTNAIISTNSSLNGTSYEKTGNLVSIVTNVSVPYTIVNKPEVINNTPLQVELGSTMSNDDLLAKIGNKDGWEVESITPPSTNSTGSKSATVVLRHPNLPESDNQTFTIPVNVVDTTPPVFGATIPDLYLLKGVALDYAVNITDNVSITRTDFVRNGNDSVPIRTFPLTRFGLSVVLENGEVKIKGVDNTFSTVEVGDGITRMIVRATDGSRNTGDSNRFNFYAVDVQGGSITKDFGQPVTEAEILAQTSLLSRGRLLPNGISDAEARAFTKEIVSVNGQLYNNNLPSRGNNTVRVRYTNRVTGQSKEVDVAVNFGEPPYCVKPANRTGEGLSIKVGITDLGRAGETPESWPMLRKGGWIALESNDKGFVITRMNTAQINALTAQEGMMVYDKDAQCLKIYDGTKWACFSKPACPVE